MEQTTNVGEIAPEGEYNTFRKYLSSAEIEALRQNAGKMVAAIDENPAVLLGYGKEIVDEYTLLATSLLEEQKSVAIPSAEVIVNNILDDLSGYARRYSDTGANKRSFFSKWWGDKKYGVEAMVRDAKPLTKKMDEARNKLINIECELTLNLNRAKVFRDELGQKLREMIKALATLGEMIHLQQESISSLKGAIDAASGQAGGDFAKVDYAGEALTLAEAKLLLQRKIQASLATERAWADWRTKFFLAIANIQSSQNLIEVSNNLLHTCNRVRTDGLLMAQVQLAAWQEAEVVRQSAQTIKSVNEGINKLVVESMLASKDAIKLATEANAATALEVSSIESICESLKDQVDILSQAEAKGKQARAHTIATIERAEKQLAQAISKAKQRGGIGAEKEQAEERAQGESLDYQMGLATRLLELSE